MGTVPSSQGNAAAQEQTHCSERRRLMEKAVRRRRQLASSHTEYLRSLRSVASALTGFAAAQPFPFYVDGDQQGAQPGTNGIGGKEATTEAKRRSLTDVAKELGENFGKVIDAGKGEVSTLLEASTDESGGRPAGRSSNFLGALFRLSGPSVAQDRTIGSMRGDPRHSSTLQQLLVWEKKLCKELKMQATKQRQAQDDKTSAELKTNVYTASDIAVLRDKHLDGQVRKLRDGTVAMWKEMHKHHQKQSEIAVKSLSRLSSGISEEHKHKHNKTEIHPDPDLEATRALKEKMKAWRKALSDMANHQRHYVHALHGWLELSLKLTNRSGDAVKLTAFVEGWRKNLDRVHQVQDREHHSVSRSFKSFHDAMGALHDSQKTELRKARSVVKRSGERDEKLRTLQKVEDGYNDSQLLAAGSRRREVHDAEVEKRKKGIEECNKELDRERKSHADSVKETRAAAVTAMTKLPAVFEAMVKFSESLAVAPEGACKPDAKVQQ